MRKTVKLIMELIFIFILPLLFILLSIDIKKEDVYNTDNLLESETKTFEYNNQLLIDIDTPQYINYLDFNQLITNGKAHFIIESDRNYQINLGFNNNNLLNHKLYIKTNYPNNVQLWVMDSIAPDTWVLPNQDSVNQSSYINSIYNMAKNHYFLRMQPFDLSYEIGNEFILQIYDLTQMYGAGYEPTITEFESIFNQNYYDYTSSEIVTVYDNNILSSKYKVNYTVFGSLKKLVLDQFHVNDNFIIKVLFDYTVIWFVMFLLWHLFYGLFDGLIHMLSFDRKRE